MIKKCMFWLLYLLFLFSTVVSALAITVNISDPAIASAGDFTYELDGSLSITCGANPGMQRNITSVSLNVRDPWNTGLFSTNQTNTTDGGENATVSRIFTLPSADNSQLSFTCGACDYNRSAEDIQCVNSTESNNINFQYAPTVTINSPADNAWSDSASNVLNFTVNSSFNSETFFYCRIWDDSSSTLGWVADETSYTVTDDASSYQLVTHIFDEVSSGITWSVRCAEASDSNVYAFATNQTLNLDASDPSVSLAPSSGTYLNSKTIDSLIVTATDTNVDSCSLFTNFSGTYAFNQTNNSMTTGVAYTFGSFDIGSDGTYIVSVACNDSSGTSISSSNQTLYVDTVYPGNDIIVNVTYDACDAFYVNVTTDESSNSTLMYGSAAATLSSTSADASYSTNHLLSLSYAGYEEKTMYFNVSSCDLAGNCNNSGEYSTTAPVSLCTGGKNDGWSAYMVLEASTSFSKVLNDSKADYIYWWNQTGQAWKYAQYGTSITDTALSYGTAVFLYEATNSSWFRPDSATGNYTYDFKVGDNFLGAYEDFDFNNFTVDTLNASFVTTAYYNNSAKDWVLHYYDTSWNNNTPILRGDVIWSWSSYAVSWNGTALV